jgi:2-methylcitrate dehydratase PrpD
MVSAIALRRTAGIHEFNDEFVRSSPVQEMMRKVVRVVDSTIDAQGWEKIRSTVEVDLDDGRTLVQHADERYRGGPDLPFTRDELFEKFSECASLVLLAPSISEAFAMVDSLERLPDISTLVHLLANTDEPLAVSS